MKSLDRRSSEEESVSFAAVAKHMVALLHSSGRGGPTSRLTAASRQDTSIMRSSSGVLLSDGSDSAAMLAEGMDGDGGVGNGARWRERQKSRK